MRLGQLIPATLRTLLLTAIALSVTTIAIAETDYNFNQSGAPKATGDTAKSTPVKKAEPTRNKAPTKERASIFAGPLPARYKGTYAAHPEAHKFIEEAATLHKFDRKRLLEMFSKVRKRKDVLRLMNRQAEDMPWHRYRRLFIRNKRISKGARFYRKHARTLARAERKYGVPKEIIVAIIGVETFYGTRKGRNRILESVSTLAFDYPRRSKFFKKQLMEFLLLAREQGWDPVKLKGSFAGAMGAPQFIPSSYRKYAVDFDGDGKIDLFNSKADAIGSVANYFSRFGWQRGKLIITRARVRGKGVNRISNFKSLPNTTIRELAKHGVKPRFRLPAYAKKEKVAIIKLQQPKHYDYWIGFKNFYVITRYNHSNHYAKVVFDLSRKIKYHAHRKKKSKRKRRRSRKRSSRK